jgi:hypothetical protein
MGKVDGKLVFVMKMNERPEEKSGAANEMPVT